MYGDEGNESSDCSEAADKIFCWYDIAQKYTSFKWLKQSCIKTYLKLCNILEY